MAQKYPISATKIFSIKTPEEAISGLWRINEIILTTTDIKKLSEKIVNVMLEELGYLKLGYVIIVLSLLDKNKEELRRVSISQTDHAKRALHESPVEFKDIVFNMSEKDNLPVKSLADNTPYITEDLSDMLFPSIDKNTVRRVQADLRIKTSLVFPVVAQNEKLGTIIFSLNKPAGDISNFEKQILIGFTNAAGVAIQHALLLERLRQVNEKLVDLDKQKNEFIGMAAHELRAPLTAVKGYVSMLLEGDAGDMPEKARGFLADTGAVTDRMIRLVNNMLNVARIEEGRIVFQMEETSVIKAVQESYYSFRFEAERKGIDMKISVPDGMNGDVYADPDRLREVVGNFVSNAIKYTEKGTVEVKISQPTEQSVKVEVIDTGSGISDAEQKKLFQKFYRVEATAGKTIGTGLGLYISRLYIKHFKGKIGISSKVDQGSNFWFELPVYTPEAVKKNES